MSNVIREIWLLGRNRAAIVALVLLAVFAAAGVAIGLANVARDQAMIDRMLAGQPAEEAAVAGFVEDAGYGAYYGFQPVWDPPSDLAFAALGNRDIAPAILRVRSLSLEAQLYENESANPELSLAGRFDLVFITIYIAPLVLIALLHDVWSGEREAGRLFMLSSLPGARRRLWTVRIAVRIAGVLAALVIPFAVGAILAGTELSRILAFGGLITLACLFWSAVILLVARRGTSSVVNAATLASIWFALTLVVPAAANLVINASVPVPDGAELARENREFVHGAWDRPREQTMEAFLALYPQHEPGSALPPTFHYKWYFAFQHLGDLHVAQQSQAYRDGIAGRAAYARAAGWLLPPAGIAQAMTALAGTDVTAQLEFQQRIRAYHTRLREYYYDYLFSERPFDVSILANVPRFAPADDGDTRAD
ncbi:ABC transporter permease [Blastomonas sp.]|uniref:ABC transporter permease n=1 Tax=Blastomonas sp. TaxID=1909299 RepID=UPI00359348BB